MTLNKIVNGQEVVLTNEFNSKYRQEILRALQQRLEDGKADEDIDKKELSRQISTILKMRIQQKQKDGEDIFDIIYDNGIIKMVSMLYGTEEQVKRALEELYKIDEEKPITNTGNLAGEPQKRN